jgi:hypothetical protein
MTVMCAAGLAKSTLLPTRRVGESRPQETDIAPPGTRKLLAWAQAALLVSSLLLASAGWASAEGIGLSYPGGEWMALMVIPVSASLFAFVMVAVSLRVDRVERPQFNRFTSTK